MKNLTLDKIKFQPRIKDFFESAINTDKLAHAYLFWGPNGSGKLFTALEIARNIKIHAGDNFFNTPFSILEHPDIRIIIPCAKKQADDPIEYQNLLKPLIKNPFVIPSPGGSTRIYINLVRDLIKWFSISPTYPGGKFVIIAGAEKMFAEVANAFLKTLEEPKPGNTIFLTTNEPDSLLATIRSRSQFVNFPPIKTNPLSELISHYYETDNSEEIAKLSSGSMVEAFDIISGSLEDVHRNAQEMLQVLMSGKLENVLTWANSQPQDRQYMQHIVLFLLEIVREAMICFSTNEKSSNNIVNQIADRSTGFSGFRQSINMLETTLYEIRLNPQYDLFWSYLPFSLFENLKLKRQ